MAAEPLFRWWVQGEVQGVGFRPAVARLAAELRLSGWVRNSGKGVEIVLIGAGSDRFWALLPDRLPAAARVDAIIPVPLDAATITEANAWPTGAFAIRPNTATPGLALAPERAVCPACMAELCNPTDRRWRYPFVACTACGPRYTVSTALPYARQTTTLSAFPLCEACAQEFHDPGNRRYHAETTACPQCGPQLVLKDRYGQVIAGDPIAQAVALLRSGAILAVKGLGGFQLACDATQPEVVARLRARKRRPTKPFAVMAVNAASLDPWVEWEESVFAAFNSPEAPIVLVPLTARAAWLDALAPELAFLGVMRPTTPLHLLLWHEAAGRPVGTDWLVEPHPMILVMTSGNVSGAPLAADDDEAYAALGAIADAFLTHDRPIAARIDDSVVRIVAEAPLVIRRARGYVPQTLPFPELAPGLALGSDLKLAPLWVADGRAVPLPYLGELTNRATYVHAERTVRQWQRWLGVTPQWIAHDAHPDAWSRHLAEVLAAEWSVPTTPVWHHVAHLAAVVAEWGAAAGQGPWIGWAIDGFGWGPDHQAWGGELLLLAGDGQWQRLAHLPPLPLPGGDLAVREPWRLAVALLHHVGADEATLWRWWRRRQKEAERSGRFWPSDRAVAQLWAWLQAGGPMPTTTSLGRWFDAVAALLGLCAQIGYEAEAAMRLESLAWLRQSGSDVLPANTARATQEAASGLERLCLESTTQPNALPHCHSSGQQRESLLGNERGGVLLLAEAEPTPALAWAVHEWFAAALTDGLRAAASPIGVAEPVCYAAGGVVQNRVLVEALARFLAAAGWELRLPRVMPPNDGGIALGQAWWVWLQSAAKGGNRCV